MIQSSVVPMMRRALKETEAPPDVDTLRDTECPVCSATDSFQGDTCSVCHSPKPPRDFMAPDTSRAKDIERVTDGDPGQTGEGIDPTDPDDVGQEDPDADPDADGIDELPGEEGNEDPEMDGGGDLICPECGSDFPSAQEDEETAQPHLDPAAETVPLADDPMDAEDPEVDQDMEETAYEPGDECPVCGQGILVPEDEVADPDGDDEIPEDEDEEEEEEDPDDENLDDPNKGKVRPKIV